MEPNKIDIETLFEDLLDQALALRKKLKLDYLLNTTEGNCEFIVDVFCPWFVFREFFLQEEINDIFKLEIFAVKREIGDSFFYSKKYRAFIFFDDLDRYFKLCSEMMLRQYPSDAYLSYFLAREEDVVTCGNILKEGGVNFYFIKHKSSKNIDKFKLYNVDLFDCLKELGIISQETCGKMRGVYDDYEKKVHSIDKKTLKDFAKEPKFRRLLLEKAFEKILLNYTDKEKKLVFDYILESDFSDYATRALGTYVYCSAKIDRDKDAFDNLDLTFIVVSLFKLVETMFCKLVNLKWHDKVITPLHGKNRRPIYLSDEDLSLGSLNKIFDCNDRDINDFLYKRQKYADDLYIMLDRFINYSRNGFLHKDAIEDSENLDVSIDDSLNSIFLLVLLFR